MLSIHEKPEYDNSIISYEHRIFLPYSTARYSYSDTVRVPLALENAFINFHDGSLLIQGKVKSLTAAAGINVYLGANSFF